MTKRIKVVDAKEMIGMSGGLLIVWLFFIEKLLIAMKRKKR